VSHWLFTGPSGHNSLPLYTPTKGQKYKDPAKKSNVTYMDAEPSVPATKLILENFDHTNFGYLLVTASSSQLQISYQPVSQRCRPRSFVSLNRFSWGTLPKTAWLN
jgi:hypothetical protein